jgi:imidazolonepropionase-like amidohydrolase/ABC-type multidrug transport system permease subunit
MNAYLTLIKIDIRLAFRQRIVIFSNYLMPLLFFFVFAQAFRASQGGAILQVVAMVIVIGILGNGLIGAGIRAAQEREANILRRYKVAPISPLPLLVASTITGLVVYLPCVLGILALATWRYGMAPIPNLASMLIFVVLGVIALRSIGLLVASVVNSTQENAIIVQIIYMAMLFLSGATLPVQIFPNWLLVVTQFIPATWLMTGLQGIMLRNETLLQNWQPAGAMLLTAAVGLLLCVKLFRWEKEEKMRPAAKLWLVAVLLPFVLLGTWQARTKENVAKTRVLSRELARSRTSLIRNARIFIGDGRVIENGAILVKAGKIVKIYEGVIPDPKSLNAEPIEAAGKTVLPGLIDMHVYAAAAAQRNLAAYLYSGVTAVQSVGDDDAHAREMKTIVNGGQKPGAEFFTTGPVLIAKPAGLPVAMFVAHSPAEARHQVDALAQTGVSAIEVFSGFDAGTLNAISKQAHTDRVPIVIHTVTARDVIDAMRVHADGIDHGSMQDRITDDNFADMAKLGITYDPSLSAAEAAKGNANLLNRSLVQQVVPPATLTAARNSIHTDGTANLDIARDNLLRAYRAGVPLVTGSDAGIPLVFHGPTVQHEMQLWVEAGIPPQVALRAATLNAAKALHAAERIGTIEAGKEATLLIVDGNPLQDIKATEAISLVMFKGENVDRSDLLQDSRSR